MMSALNFAIAPVNKPGDELSRLNHTNSSTLPSEKDSHLSGTIKKSDRIDEWVTANRRTRSRKLDLLAAIIEVEDEAVINALLISVRGKEHYNEQSN